MKRRTSFLLLVLALAVLLSAAAVAQRGRFQRRRAQVEMLGDRRGVPDWENDDELKDDVFTFVRIQYSSYGGRGWGGGRWATDYPDSDLNFSYRLHQLTSLEVDPDGKILELTDEALFDYPFIYMIEPGSMLLTEPK